MLCRAKINLTLHVGATLNRGRWAGYHPVESLVVFAEMGDLITVEPAEQASLSIVGPFAEGLSAGADNLILKTLRTCGASAHSVQLEKNIPVAAGLGGGSANAAGILRLFDPDAHVDAASMGADVPVCYLSRTAMMEGIGERVTPQPGLGTIPAVLVNPGVSVSTGAIFNRFDTEDRDPDLKTTDRSGSLLQRALSGCNDLQAVAIAEQPVIKTVLDAIAAQPGCQLARMSGSGATCFGLFETDDKAQSAAKALNRSGWWVMPTRLGGPD